MNKQIYQKVAQNLKAKGIEVSEEEVRAIDRHRWEWIKEVMKDPPYAAILVHKWGRYILIPSKLTRLLNWKQLPEEDRPRLERYLKLITDYRNQYRKHAGHTKQRTRITQAEE